MKRVSRSMIPARLKGLALACLCLASTWTHGREPATPISFRDVFSEARELLPAQQEKKISVTDISPAGDKALGKAFAGEPSSPAAFTFQLLDMEGKKDGAAMELVLATDEQPGRGQYPSGKRIWSHVSLNYNMTLDVPVKSGWLTVRLWHSDGRKKTYSPPTRHRVLDGEVKLTRARSMSTFFPDGVELAFDERCMTELAGQRLTLRDVSLSVLYWETWFRKEFTIPQGRIWRAAASSELLTHNTIYVNGRRVEDASLVPNTGIEQYNTTPVDLTPYVQPGRNCIGVHVHRMNYAYTTLQGSIIMTTGERIDLATGPGWEWHTEHADGWTTAGFKGAGWRQVAEHDRETPTLAGFVPVGRPGNRYRFNYKYKTDMPAYSGFMLIESPADNKLYFDSGAPVVLNVRTPVGFFDDRPRIEWMIQRFDGDGFEEFRSGHVDAFTSYKDSLVFHIESAPAPSGVYTLALTLFKGDKEVEKRLPEPLVFLQKLAMHEVPGETYEQGLDLDLERVIDLTDPDDPAPWIETDAAGNRSGYHGWTDDMISEVTEPRIVQKEGLEYRETSPNRWAQISFKVEVEHPGDFYMAVLEYPNNTNRMMGVACNSGMFGDGRVSKCGPSIQTGVKYPTDNSMHELKWLWIPDAVNALNLINLLEGSRAAASKLSIYHVKGSLPALAVPATPLYRQRKFGLLTERDYSGKFYSQAGAALTFTHNPYRVHPEHKYKLDREFSDNPIQNRCDRLQQLVQTGENVASYLRFAGHNIHVMGCYQYTNKNTPYVPHDGSTRVPLCIRNVLARVFLVNDIDFLASVEFGSTTEMHTRQQAGENFSFLDMGGKQRPERNFMLPAVREQMLRVASELAVTFGRLPNFRGINWTTLLGYKYGGDWGPSYGKNPLAAGYGDFTIDLFEKETGLTVPVSDTGEDRFLQRCEVLTSPPLKKVWLEWRAAKLHDAFTEFAGIVRKERPDLLLYAGAYFFLGDFLAWRESGQPFAEYCLEHGWMPDLFEETDSVRPVIWAFGIDPATNLEEHYATRWHANADPEYYAPFSDLSRRGMMIRYGWTEVENAAGMLPRREGWPRPFQQTMYMMQTGDFVREPYTQAMIGLDPQSLWFGFCDSGLFIGNEQPRREFARVFKNLPRERLSRVLDTGFDTNLALRQLRKDGRLIVSAANPGYWPVTGSVRLSGAQVASSFPDGEVLGKTEPGAADLTVPVSLTPFGVAAFTVTPGTAVIESWQTEPVPEKHLDHMTRLLAEARKAMENPFVQKFSNAPFIRNSISTAAQAIEKHRYALAWSTLTHEAFWDTVYRRAPNAENEHKSAQRRETTVPRVAALPVVDGELTDPAWEEAPRLSGFFDRRRRPVRKPTFAYAVHDGKSLYIAFRCEDKHPSKLRALAREETDIFQDDVVDVFLMPPGLIYYQMAVNPAGTKFDQKCYPGGRDYVFSPDWDAAARTDDSGWSVEMRIPFAAFGATMAPGTVWKGNFHRAFSDDTQPASWSYTRNWHNTDAMAPLTFE